MQCNALNNKTIPKQIRLYFRGHYHESSDCFEYLKKSLPKSPLIKLHKNYLPIFPTQINPGIENFKPQKIIR